MRHQGPPGGSRRLTDPVPEWERMYVDRKVRGGRTGPLARILGAAETVVDQCTHPRALRSAAEILACAGHLVDLDRLGRRVVVVGCGPSPEAMVELQALGCEVVGVEPVADAVREAAAYVAGRAAVLPGTAERLPVADRSQSLVLMENVLEHVDSVTASLAEAFRVLRPGGVLFVRTTNRRRFSVTGVNWEFSTRFFNWFPRMVKESYVFVQLHHRPELAHYSPRPAVHWFSYPDLCDFGREVGFARFYSPYDLLYLTRQASTPAWRLGMQRWCRRRPWLRALIVGQMVGDIFMWKRHDQDPGRT